MGHGLAKGNPYVRPRVALRSAGAEDPPTGVRGIISAASADRGHMPIVRWGGRIWRVEGDMKVIGE